MLISESAVLMLLPDHELHKDSLVSSIVHSPTARHALHTEASGDGSAHTPGHSSNAVVSSRPEFLEHSSKPLSKQ